MSDNAQRHGSTSKRIPYLLGIIFFLGAMSAIFYVVWLKKLQENRWGVQGKSPKIEASPPPKAEAPPEKKKE